MHIGGQFYADEDVRILAPSPISHETCHSVPVELTVQEIKGIIDDFIKAAHRAKLGGIDGIELKCDQGFLIYQFLSPLYNRRSDKFGGSHKKRLRFLLDIIKGVRAVVGSDFVIGVRITGDAMTPGDLTLTNAIKISRDLEATGLIDYIHVNGATNSTFRGYLASHGDSSVARMNFVPLAKEIKAAVNLPVIAASMISHPSEAEHVVSSGFADMVAMTRAHIAEAEIVNKIRDGKIEDIRPCVLSNQGCVGNHWKGLDVRCIHNPATGRERELGIGTITKAEDQKEIAVVGGGIAGMEVARVAAMRGHKVTLFERQKLLGGQILLASKFPYRQGLLDIAHYLELQIKKLKIDIYCGVEVKSEDILSTEEDFDAIVIATGADFFSPPLYEKRAPASVLSIRDVLEEKVQLGNNILVVDSDWRHNPLAVVEWLIQRDRKVTVISSAYFVGKGLDVVTLASYYSRIQKAAKFLPLTDLVSLKNKTAYLRNVLTNELEEIYPIDQVVFVSSMKPVADLYFNLKNKLHNVFRVGDCIHPLSIPNVMLEANRLARTL